MSRLLGIEGYDKNSAKAQFAFTPRADARIIDKESYSGVGPELIAQLRDWSVGKTYICGVDTDQCVLMTAADLLQNDVLPIVCENLTASAAGPKYHESGIFLLRRLIGREQVFSVSV